MSKNILIVVANPQISTTVGGPVGLWASELFHPLKAFEDAGYDSTIASPDGGSIEFDAMSDPRDASGYSASDTLSLVGQKVMPFRIEDEARSKGANFVTGPAFEPFATQDGNLITGQQQNSGTATAQLIIKALEG